MESKGHLHDADLVLSQNFVFMAWQQAYFIKSWELFNSSYNGWSFLGIIHLTVMIFSLARQRRWWKTGCKIQLFVFFSFHVVFFFSKIVIPVNALNLHQHLQEQIQYGVDGGTISNATRIVRYELQVSSTLEMRYLVLTTKRWGAVDDRKTTSNIQKKSLKPGLENREGVKRKAKLENLVRRRENWRKLNILT